MSTKSDLAGVINGILNEPVATPLMNTDFPVLCDWYEEFEPDAPGALYARVAAGREKLPEGTNAVEWFRQGILEHREDDTVYLAYAAWLEQQGDACGKDRAAFIRLQTLLEHMHPGEEGFNDIRTQADAILARKHDNISNHRAWAEEDLPIFEDMPADEQPIDLDGRYGVRAITFSRGVADLMGANLDTVLSVRDVVTEPAAVGHRTRLHPNFENTPDMDLIETITPLQLKAMIAQVPGTRKSQEAETYYFGKLLNNVTPENQALAVPLVETCFRMGESPALKMLSGIDGENIPAVGYAAVLLGDAFSPALMQALKDGGLNLNERWDEKGSTTLNLMIKQRNRFHEDEKEYGQYYDAIEALKKFGAKTKRELDTPQGRPEKGSGFGGGRGGKEG